MHCLRRRHQHSVRKYGRNQFTRNELPPQTEDIHAAGLIKQTPAHARRLVRVWTPPLTGLPTADGLFFVDTVT